MAYTEQKSASRQIPSVAGVVIVHALIGYAFVSGLAYNVVKDVLPVFTVRNIEVPPPPPPNPPEPATKPTPRQTVPEERFTSVTPTFTLPGEPGPTVLPLPEEPVRPAEPAVRETPPPLPSKAAGPRVAGNRAAWITTEDYPSAALRAEEQGVVAISVGIGSDGRVTSCTVTGSSGHAALDAVTCRLYTRRARFTPALDAEGMPIASTYTDRVRWELPRE